MPKKLTADQISEKAVRRIEINLPASELVQLAELEKKLRISRTELVRYSLALFQWAAKEVKAGRSFGTFDAETREAKEVLLPGLTGLAGQG